MFKYLTLRASLRKMKRIPADLRDLESLRNDRFHRNDIAFNQTESLMLSIFHAALEQHLHAQTDSKQRFSLCRLFFHQIPQAGFLQLLRRVCERADARQNNLICRLNLLPIARQRDIRADSAE